MADVRNPESILSVIATSSSRVKELPIKDSQLIFIQNKGRIAFDFNGKRVFYNQITEIDTELERSELVSPLPGYYFVIDRAELWLYKDEAWIQITKSPDEVIFIGVELPELGQAKTLYIDKDDREISIWDEETEQYITVSNYTAEATYEDIESLF